MHDLPELRRLPGVLVLLVGTAPSWPSSRSSPRLDRMRPSSGVAPPPAPAPPGPLKLSAGELAVSVTSSIWAARAGPKPVTFLLCGGAGYTCCALVHDAYLCAPAP
jgi:hypothetical protein